MVKRGGLSKAKQSGITTRVLGLGGGLATAGGRAERMAKLLVVALVALVAGHKGCSGTPARHPQAIRAGGQGVAHSQVG